MEINMIIIYRFSEITLKCSKYFCDLCNILIGRLTVKMGYPYRYIIQLRSASDEN